MGSCRICGKELAQDSFVIVESNPSPEVRHHARLTRKSKIKDLVERETINKDDFRCRECVQLILTELDDQIKEAELERNTYLKYLQENESETLDQEKQEIIKQITQLLEEEQACKETLQFAQTDKISMLNMLHEQQQDSKEIALEEKEYWGDFADFQQRLNNLQEDYQTVIGRNQYGSLELQKLEQTNVYRDTFFIDTSGRIGTINNFRLGRLADAPVEWEEINAAWGQVTFLLYIISKKSGVSLKHYRLRPMGNRSTIEEAIKDSQPIIRDLWGSDDLGFGSWFWGFGKKNTNTTFDDGMVAFLHCLRQVCEKVEEIAVHPRIPYSISGDKIGHQSIRMQSTTEESWTKSLKNLLTNLNFLLAWTSSNSVKLAKK